MTIPLEPGMTITDPATRRCFMFLGKFRPGDSDIFRFAELLGDDPPCLYAWRPIGKVRNDTLEAIGRAVAIGPTAQDAGITGELVRLREKCKGCATA